MIEVSSPGREWRPTKRQEDFISIPDSISEGFYGGAAGGGKTDVLLMLPIVRGFYQHPRFHGIIFRRTFPQLEESLIHRSKVGVGDNGPSFYDFGARYNDQKHVWTFPEGATYRFSYLETDDDARAHQTAEYHYAGFDELTHFQEYQYNYITHSRVRTTISNLPAIVRSASNPGNIGHAWVFSRFVEPAILGYTRVIDPTGQSRIYIPAKVQDNPHLLRVNPTYINKLQQLPETERRALLDGDWSIFAGQVFTEFRIIHMPGEPENAVHVIEPIKIEDWWPKVLAVDWGYTAMTWCGLAAVTPWGEAILYKEMTAVKRSIKEWGSDLGTFMQHEKNVVASVLDKSAWGERGEEKSLREQIEDASGCRFEKSDSDRVSGKQLLHDFLRWKPRPPRFIPPEGYSHERANQIMRLFGMDAYRDYIKLFQPDEPETNIPRLKIFNTCPKVIRAIQLCVYDEKHKEDVLEFDGDDPYDGIRYLLKKVDAYLHGVKKEHEKIQALGKILDQLEKGGGYTKFYREMEKHESKNQTKIGVHRRQPFFH